MIAAILMVAAMLVMYWTVRRLLQEQSVLAAAVAVFAPLMLAMNTSIVVWSMSGLENPLTVLLLCLLLRSTVGTILGERLFLRSALAAAALAAALAMTRPDLILFSAAWPFVTVACPPSETQRRSRRTLVSLLCYCVVFGAAFGGFLAFRWTYFHLESATK